MKLKVYNAEGTSDSEKEFSQIPVLEGDKGKMALKELIVAYQANLRQGNASTKTRAEVSGTGKKPWRQKGTGMARHGSKRSPIWVGGGVAHGPRPRDYRKDTLKKVRKLALKRAVVDCIEAGKISIIETLTSPEPKTKVFNAQISKMMPTGNVLLVDSEFEEKLILAARNIDRVYMVDSESLNAWDLIRHNNVLFSEKGFERFMQRVNA